MTEPERKDPVKRNFVAISAPKTGDVICGTKVTAGGTYNGVTKIEVTFAGKTASATLHPNGAWRTTFDDIDKGKYNLTATPNSGAEAKTEYDIVVEKPCNLRVDNPPPVNITQNYVVSGIYNSTPNGFGERPSVTADLIHPPPSPPSPFPIPRTSVLTIVTPGTGDWTFTLPAVAANDGYCLEVRRNDGSTGSMLNQITIGPFTIG